MLASVPQDDRGLAYGDGLFETVLLHHGRPVLWSYHCARLFEGARRLTIPAPSQNDIDRQLAGKVTSEWEVLKLTLTRGSGGRGYLPPATPTPRLLTQRTAFTPAQARWQDGCRVRLCSLRLGHQPLLAGIKHLNRLENVLARQEWTDAGIAEGILADTHGSVIEATCMNLFWAEGDAWYTPPLEACGVAGTLRAALLDAGAIRPRTLMLEALPRVSALWLGNSVQGVWQVTELVSSSHQVLAQWPRLSVDAFQALGHRLLGYAAP
ncbi:aminodeoxychorismate lyase [Halomonas dongshanensis]|uniref:Aminodeoxychorismate lyase n=1 Tax=Halomonas dongshanensis TaxID=2890835 RepID=A0ABT2EHI7_9GAMM|nr:aminodeoxychorismate lyase [Halomonas dongshanensis]MCS2610072.1 aminodeoxychorismate lyase [Halomonas dongshanensis]